MPAAKIRSERAGSGASTISPNPSSAISCCKRSAVRCGDKLMDEHVRILIVDDDAAQLDLVARLLRLEGFEVATTLSSFGTSNLIRSFSPKVVLLDVNIPALA